MKFAAMTVWYNPDASTVKNLYTFSSRFKTVYIIDNSEGDNSALLTIQGKAENNIVYIPNHKNLGIAAALNMGCTRAMSDGFDWILTMDQDSFWDDAAIVSYIGIVRQIAGNKKVIVKKLFIDNRDGSISSVAADSSAYCIHSVVGYILRFIHFHPDEFKPLIEYPDRCITSGNFIKLSSWKKIGKFKEELFIDEVDHDFCYRLREHGLKILMLNNISFHHQVGEQKRTLMPHFHRDWHNSFRLYYMVRNGYYIMRKYPEMSKKFGYERCLKYLKGQYCTGLLNKDKKKNRAIFEAAMRDSDQI